MNETLAAWLAEQGWREFPASPASTCERNWAKTFDVEPRCRTNKNKPLSLVLSYWQWPDDTRGQFELDLTAEPRDGIWVKLTVYTLSDRQLRNQLDRQVQKLLRAWVAANAEATTLQPISVHSDHAIRWKIGE